MSGESDHIPFEALLDLVEERASAGQVAAVQAHIETCPRCERDLAWASRITSIMRADSMEDAPPHVIARAVRALRPEVVPEPAPGALRRLIARLQFDSGAGLTPAFGMRSGQPDARQMLFTTEEVEVDLRITPVRNLWVVSGQMLGPCEGGSVELVSCPKTHTAILNELCEFSLPPVEAGSYTLLLRYAGAEVEVSNLQIGEGRGPA
ncbi:MAG: hypothetical protein H0V47_10505 [Chloroflexia bacterium]|nr:hypothetical protein [Chloroflexia bacterium]